MIVAVNIDHTAPEARWPRRRLKFLKRLIQLHRCPSLRRLLAAHILGVIKYSPLFCPALTSRRMMISAARDRLGSSLQPTFEPVTLNEAKRCFR